MMKSMYIADLLYSDNVNDTMINILLEIPNGHGHLTVHANNLWCTWLMLCLVQFILVTVIWLVYKLMLSGSGIKWVINNIDSKCLV